MKSKNNPFHRQIVSQPKEPATPSLPEQRQHLPTECQTLMDAFHAQCMASWVQHFESLRERDAVVLELQKKGYMPLNDQTAAYQ